MSVVELEVAQPMELFDESSLPIRQDLVEMVQERSFVQKQPDSARFSGKIIIRQMMNNEELCTQVCTSLLIGLSPKLIGKRFGMSPRSVINIRDAMEERGELAPVGKRIRAQLDRFVELGLERMVEGVLTGEIHAGQLPIPVLAAIDKKGQLDAGVVPGTGRTEEAITLERVLLDYAAGKAALEAQSEGKRMQLPAQQPSALPLSGAESMQESANASRMPASDLVLDVAATAPEPAKAGAGGVAVSPAAHSARGDGPENFGP